MNFKFYSQINTDLTIVKVMDINQSHGHEKNMIENIYEHYKNNQLCDVVLISKLFFYNFCIASI